MAWNYYNPVFAYESVAPTLKQWSAWSGHRRFAYDLIRFMKPQTLVELGTHWGLSFFSFCQAAADGRTGTRCYAVDSWVGDDHAGHYPETVYQTVGAIANAFYPNVATLIRNTFDGALPLFADGSVDVLHIDGYHTYEAVCHDYQSWLPKLAKDGVVLFHDTAVRANGFGVYRLWEQLKVYPHLEFDHGFGLGVVFPKGCPEPFLKVVKNGAEMKPIYERTQHL